MKCEKTWLQCYEKTLRRITNKSNKRLNVSIDLRKKTERGRKWEEERLMVKQEVTTKTDDRIRFFKSSTGCKKCTVLHAGPLCHCTAMNNTVLPTVHLL